MVNFFCITYGFAATGHIFLPIFPYKTPKKYLTVGSLQTRSYTAECFRLFRVVVEGPKGCLLLVAFCVTYPRWWMAVILNFVKYEYLRTG